MSEKENIVEITNGEVSFDLSNVYITEYYKKKKGKKYKYFYCYKNSLMQDFIDKVFLMKTPKKHPIWLINPKTRRFRNVK